MIGLAMGQGHFWIISVKPCKLMALCETQNSAEADLFRQELANLINLATRWCN